MNIYQIAGIIYIHIGMNEAISRERESDRQTDRQTETDRDRQRPRERDTQRDTHKDTQRQQAKLEVSTILRQINKSRH